MKTNADVMMSKFECRACGKCCSCGGDMLLSTHDVHNIELYLELTAAESADIFNEHFVSGQVFYTLKQQVPCYFMDKLDRTCTIHEVKPKACRDYPFKLLVEKACTLEACFVCPEARDLFVAWLRSLE